MMDNFLVIFIVVTILGYLVGAVIAAVRAKKTPNMFKYDLILYGSMASVVVAIGIFLLHSSQIAGPNLHINVSSMLSSYLQGDIFSLFAHGFIASIYHSAVYKKAAENNQASAPIKTPPSSYTPPTEGQISYENLETELQRLANLKANGLIDEQDYKTLKDNLMSQLSK